MWFVGRRGGLIEWVDGLRPLFALYKRWQLREAAIAQYSPAQPNAASRAPRVLRPTELLLAHVTPHLQRLDPRRFRRVALESRTAWPREALLAAFNELVSKTPADLISKCDTRLKHSSFVFNAYSLINNFAHYSCVRVLTNI